MELQLFFFFGKGTLEPICGTKFKFTELGLIYHPRLQKSGTKLQTSAYILLKRLIISTFLSVSGNGAEYKLFSLIMGKWKGR